MSVQDHKLQHGKFWVCTRKKIQCKNEWGATFVQRGCGGLYPWRFPGFDWRRPLATYSNFEAMPARRAGGTCTRLFHPESLSYYLWPTIWARDLSHSLIPCQNQTYQEVAEWAKKRGEARAFHGGGYAVPGFWVPALDSARVAWENRSWTGDQELPVWRLDAD